MSHISLTFPCLDNNSREYAMDVENICLGIRKSGLTRSLSIWLHSSGKTNANEECIICFPFTPNKIFSQVRDALKTVYRIWYIIIWNKNISNAFS